MHHPCRNDDGELVVIHRPSSATPSAHWAEPGALATAVPVCQMPASLNGLSLSPAPGMPDADEGVDEPPFTLPPGMRAAAGAVVIEDDGRVWLVSPTNGYGGYTTTFPKGRVDPGGTLQQTAIREVYEESGLLVRLDAFLIDVPRTKTYTRYYIAKRIAGCPSAMGWETQAVHLVPASRLEEIAVHPNDAAIIRAARAWLAAR
ncbi:RNA pyrophosphohydrolase [Massilia sp. Bi118]|uniref:NUDIX hydrolase n=1 Tax=Massilia sp. Bi118 TaxID=2822346 RepID=UPI001D73DF49|nr:NUDIX hydrolase [Massilia sp. Bi118]CAH0197813.1 RNA pyrophosphohydrolase [Massilia sp. Bi118]